MGIKYSDVYNHSLISDETLDCIIDTCPECGEEIEFTESLVHIYCPNDYCTLKIASRLESMAKMLKIDGWGPETCEDTVRRYRLKSPFQVFLLPSKIDAMTQGEIVANRLNSGVFLNKVNSFFEPDNLKKELWEVVKLACMPNIGTISYKLFSNYSCLADAYEDIETYQVPFIAEKLGIVNSETGVLAVTVYNTLIKYKDELLFGEKQFNLYKDTGEPFMMCITGGVNGYENKSAFVEFIKRRYNGKVNPMLMDSVTAKVKAVVAEEPSGSTKYDKAVRMNTLELEKCQKQNNPNIGVFMQDTDLVPVGQKVLISTSQELISRLDMMYGV